MTDIVLQQNDNLSLDRNPAAVYIASLESERSRNVMTSSLNTVADMLGLDDESKQRFLLIPWQNLRYQHIATLKATLVKSDLSPSSVNRILSALRGVMREAWRLEYISAEEHARINDIKGLKAKRLPAGRDLEDAEVAALLDVCEKHKKPGGDPAPSGIRDAAIIGLLYVTGLRRSEAVALQMDDYNVDSGRAIVRHGKGDKERVVYVKNKANVNMRRWLVLRGDDPGYIFRHIDRWHNIRNKGISDRALADMLNRRGKEAGLNEFTAHDFRRTFVGKMLDSGVDLSTVADIAGHASTDTTRRYDRRGDRRKEEAAGNMDLPL